MNTQSLEQAVLYTIGIYFIIGWLNRSIEKNKTETHSQNETESYPFNKHNYEEDVYGLTAYSIYEVDELEGHEFEEFLLELYQSLGYEARITKGSGDFGADLVLNKDGKTIVVQAKRYSRNVGVKAVQEVIGSKSFYHADEAWVVTNSGFTEHAIRLADASSVRLVDRDELVLLMYESRQ